MEKRLLALWCCLVVVAAMGGWAAGRLSAPRNVPAPMVVPDTASRVPVITLRAAGAGAVETMVREAEARFVQGSGVRVVPPGGSATISLP
ncbi:MAG: hypothetical protein KBC95_02360 [Candidatus Peribacteraceae bacterium]|nr:hypothetical protein [Candidatus Peribacteraceae bacterium]